MIQAKEIKVGNLVSVNGEIVEIFSLSSNGYGKYGYNLFEGEMPDFYEYEAKPIPLTSDIFRKCGFKEDGLYRYRIGNFILIEFAEGIYFLNGNSDFKISYLHQLQNLYSFTGHELIYTS